MQLRPLPADICTFDAVDDFGSEDSLSQIYPHGGANCDIAANRAYINMDAVPLYTGETGVKSLDVYYDDPDGISLISDTTPEGDGRIYDLSGRFIGNSRLPKGIYIMNGRKMVIK